MRKTVVLWCLALALVGLSTSGVASTITVTSYSMNNGDGQASGGKYNYWDTIYNGSGNHNQDNAPLSGGTGLLTDGVAATCDWSVSQACADEWVGWKINPSAATPPYSTSYGPPSVTFNFASNVNVNSITFNFADDGTYGGVALPTLVTVAMGGNLVDYTPSCYFCTEVPNGGHDFTLSGLNLTGNDASVTFYETWNGVYGSSGGNDWVMLSQVTFNSSTPEPGSMLLMATFLLGLGPVIRKKLS